jgi:hypothetical protein
MCLFNVELLRDRIANRDDDVAHQHFGLIAHFRTNPCGHPD